MNIFMLTLLLFYQPVFAARLYVKMMPPNVKLTLVSKSGKTKRLKNRAALSISDGTYRLKAEAKGYITKVIPIVASKNKIIISDKLEKPYGGLRYVTTLPVHGQPKSIVFLDKSRYAVNLLSGHGCDIYDFTNYIGLVSPAQKYAKMKGFVEGWVDRLTGEYYQSQMTTGMFHIYNLTNMHYKKSVSSHGIWTKVIKASSVYIFFSNWVSRNVTIFDRKTKKFIKKIRMMGIPRGMAVTPDEKYLYVAIFDHAAVQKIDLKTLKIIKTIVLHHGTGAARHIVLDARNHWLYVSDMAAARVYKIDFRNDKILSSVKVFDKPNTIVLSPDGYRLFVSCRGPNGPNGYLEKGLVFGKVMVVDTRKMRVEDWVWAGNQPTGLDISPDGKYLMIGDFLDHVVEVYRVYTGLIMSKY